MKSRLRRLAPKLLFTVFVLVLTARGLDLARIAEVLGSASLPLAVVGALCTVLLNLLRPLRWLWLLQSQSSEVDYVAALRSHMFAVGTRLVVPSHLGELGKALAVRVDPAKGGGLAAIDILLDVSTTFVVAAAGATFVLGPLPITIAAAALLLLALLRPLIGRWLEAEGAGPVRARLADAWRAGREVPTGVLFRGTLLSFALQGLRLLQLVILAWALGATLSASAVAVFPAIQVADAFSFTVGRVGVREWFGAQILPHFGLDAELAVSAIFLQTMVSNLLPGLIGAAVVYSARRDALAQLNALRAPSS